MAAKIIYTSVRKLLFFVSVHDSNQNDCLESDLSPSQYVHQSIWNVFGGRRYLL